VRLRFWGTRGSIPVPGHETIRYGGNTSCVELRSPAGELVIIDCGTGVRGLGRLLVDESARSGVPPRGSILLGHTHWDHIQGLPFFAPLFDQRSHWDLYGPRGLGMSLGQTLAGQMQYQYFPVTLDQLGGHVTYHELVEGSFSIGDLVVRTQYLNHPALTVGYRIESGGAAFCYLSDHEPFDPALAGGGDVLVSREDRRHVDFMAGADVVVHDTQYEASEYPAHIGWGHSTMEYVVDAACAAGVATVVLYHHDPSRGDDAIDALLARARERAAGRIDVRAAAEGDWVEVEARTGAVDAEAGQARSAAMSLAVDDLEAAVVVAVSDPAIRQQVGAAASAEHLAVVDLDGRAAPNELEQAACGVLVVDVDDTDNEAVLDRLGGPGGAAAQKLAVLAVTRTLRATVSVPAAVTNWLVWPASLAHIRTKLRAAVLRQACRWRTAPLPPDEDRRLGALHRLRILDTAPEERFDRYTDAACETLGVPIALISLVDTDRQWFKSRRGLPVAESSRDESLCAHAILGEDVMQVPDLLQDDRFADNPAVNGPGRARFYAGAPLILDDGSRVGTLCVIDRRPRLLDDDQLEELRGLARGVVAELQQG
jgi:phosphoribosyl 1,2-cyclic phosphodiesterase